MTLSKKGDDMTVLRKIFGTSVAIALALTISAPSSALAQAPAATPARGGDAPLYTPAAGAKDLKAVLFNWAWYMGILRSTEERDLIMTLEYQGRSEERRVGKECRSRWS